MNEMNPIPTKDGKSPGAEKMIKTWEEQADLARSYLKRAHRRMKKWADTKRRPREFSQGSMTYEGPFPVIKKIGNVVYRVELPPTLKIHPVFHVSMLKPYKGDVEDPSRGLSQRAPPLTTKSFDKEVDEGRCN
ncbi:Unknown protein [Striga hermonthica]|uniref:Tf2-1-like SH3-like domain-containing protein n=1 Tax=Striga hermonthica TaxID=68872 RepID=A0A9N7NFS9_STRHE|nr:Unknown protein [Striga hermonthica]